MLKKLPFLHIMKWHNLFLLCVLFSISSLSSLYSQVAFDDNAVVHIDEDTFVLVKETQIHIYTDIIGTGEIRITNNAQLQSIYTSNNPSISRLKLQNTNGISLFGKLTIRESIDLNHTLLTIYNTLHIPGEENILLTNTSEIVNKENGKLVFTKPLLFQTNNNDLATQPTTQNQITISYITIEEYKPKQIRNKQIVQLPKDYKNSWVKQIEHPPPEVLV